MMPLSTEQHTTLARLIHEHGLDEFDTQILKMARSAIHLLPIAEDDYAKTGATRFGGNPDLPPNFEWPTIENEHLLFLAQINLEELPQISENHLPRQGMLYFFLGLDDTAGSVEHRVVYQAEGAGLLTAEPPSNSELRANDDNGDLKPYKVSTDIVISLPSFLSRDFPEAIEDDDNALDRYFALQDNLKQVIPRHSALSQIFGWPLELTPIETMEPYLVMNVVVSKSPILVLKT